MLSANLLSFDPNGNPAKQGLLCHFSDEVLMACHFPEVAHLVVKLDKI